MRRLTAVLLGLALAWASSQGSALHAHIYTDHDHPEHHHGPATHQHHDRRAQPQDDLVRVTSCHPDAHALSLAPSCSAAPNTQVVAAACGRATTVAPLVERRLANEVTDVRAHGPPLHPDAPPRAPPPIALA